MSSERIRVAILDDYQNVAFKFGDWSGIKDRLIIDSYPDTTNDEDVLAKRLEPYTIICTMSVRLRCEGPGSRTQPDTLHQSLL